MEWMFQERYMAKVLTESLEDYLEAIAELCAEEGHAHTKAIAGKLKVKMPSVTGALRQLAEMGYIIYNTHYPVELTEKGRSIADEVVSRHRVLKRFFVDILGMPGANAGEAACHLEHLIDEDTVSRFILFSEAIENRSDARELRIFLSDAMELMVEFNRKCRTLNTLANGDRAEIVKIGRNVLSQDALGIAVGDSVVVGGMPLDKSHVHLLVNGRDVEISLHDAENIFV